MNYYRERLPRVNAHLRVGMKYLHGDKFAEYLRLYVKPLLIKGVPSIMTDLQEFYVDVTKRQQIQDLLDGWLKNMKSEMVLDLDEEVEQDPTVMAWLLYFLSQHYTFCKNQNEKALEIINEAIEHTPTLLELYTHKGKIFQQAGDRCRAADLFEKARELDQADRAINALSAL